MQKSLLWPLAAISLLTLGGVTRSLRSAASAASSSPQLVQTHSSVNAARAFLNSLEIETRAKAQFPWSPPDNVKATAAKFKGGVNGRMTFVGEQYGQAVWSNFPVSDVPRPGLNLGSLKVAPRVAASSLLRTVLSPKGYQKVIEIMDSDQALADQGTPFKAGEDSYTLGIFGTPSETTPWMIQFGGHHLALNLTFVGAQGVLAPTLTGAQPSNYTDNGKTVRVLATENDKAFALLDSLDKKQRAQALLNYEVHDLVLGPGHEGEAMQPEGLKGSELNAGQREQLLDLITEWVGITHEAFANPRLAEIKSDLDNTYFAWSGPTTHEPGHNGSAYYRLQGPKFVIEFAPQGVGGDLTNHVHTVYRDLGNDYGRAWAEK